MSNSIRSNRRVQPDVDSEPAQQPTARTAHPSRLPVIRIVQSKPRDVTPGPAPAVALNNRHVSLPSQNRSTRTGPANNNFLLEDVQVFAHGAHTGKAHRQAHRLGTPALHCGGRRRRGTGNAASRPSANTIRRGTRSRLRPIRSRKTRHRSRSATAPAVAHGFPKPCAQPRHATAPSLTRAR